MSCKAYVGSYTYRGKSKGITSYDVDLQKGTFSPCFEMPVNNCSYLCVSPDNKYLYAVVDEGVASFEIMEDGSLLDHGTISIRGLRACYMGIHPSGRYLAVGGYHDGKMTILSLKKSGGVKEIVSEYYNQGWGSVAERNFRPHISCTEFAPNGKYLAMIDSGLDQIRIFAFNETTGQIDLLSQLHCELNAGPHHLLFSKDGKYAYVINELKNTVISYRVSYVTQNGLTVSEMIDGARPEFEKLQELSTLPLNCAIASAACTMAFSPDELHLYCSNAGENSVAMFDRDPETGLLTLRRILPISGEYPKDLDLLPGGNYLVSTNQESDSLTFFRVDTEKALLVMNTLPLRCDKPNCLVIVND